MSDLPPADWYTDPEDESQYRYWDGSSWTEHRAPRHTEPSGEPGADENAMRGPGELISGTFSMARRQWRGCAATALVWVVAEALTLVLVLIAGNAILGGELGAVWDRVTEPGFDATTPENEAYFESLDVDLAPINFLPLALGALIVWIASNLVQAAATIIAISDLRGRAVSIGDTFKKSLPRIPRLMGLDLQVLALFVAALAVTVVAGAAVPLLLILLIPALIAAVVFAIPVVSMAFAFASVGPAEPSLRYGLRLVRGRFWGVLGRMLLVLLVVVGASMLVGFVFALAGAADSLAVQVVSQGVQAVVGAVVAVLLIAAFAVLYHDLGGESD